MVLFITSMNCCIPGIISSFSHSDISFNPLTRGEAARMLGSMRPPSPETIAALALAQSLKRPHGVLWGKAMDALVNMGPSAARPTARIIRDLNAGVQYLAHAVLLRIGMDAVPELQKAAAESPDLSVPIDKLIKEIRVRETPSGNP
jgi:hypothetical protein